MFHKVNRWRELTFWRELVRGIPFSKVSPTTTLLASIVLTLFGFISAINAQSYPGHNRTDKVMTSVAAAFGGEGGAETSAQSAPKPLSVDDELAGSMAEVAEMFGVHMSSRVLTGELDETGGAITVPYEALFVEGSATPQKNTETLLRHLADLLKSASDDNEPLHLKLAVQARLHEDSAQAIRWISTLAAQISYFGVPMDRFSVALVDGPQDVITFGFDVQLAEVTVAEDH